MTASRIIAIGASAGGLEALLTIVQGLPADFPVPVLVVLHLAPLRSSALPALLNRAKRMPAAYGKNREPISAGRIYIAPPDCHLFVAAGRIGLGRGPRENGSRPAIDPLFRSVAHDYGSGAIGVVLSGALCDGTAGLLAIKAEHGIAVVQDPAQARWPSMPSSALKNVAVDHVVASDQLPALLQRLVAQPHPGGLV